MGVRPLTRHLDELQGAAGVVGATIETGTVDDTTGAVSFRWGIDSNGRAYFDSTGSAPDDEAARIYMADDGRIYAEDLAL